MSDLKIISWVLVVVAQAWQGWENSYAGETSQWAGKISGYYVEESFRQELEWWASKGLAAAKQEAPC